MSLRPLRPPRSCEFPDRSGSHASYSLVVWFGVLGALTVVDEDGKPRGLAGPARRRLLAALLARVGCVVTRDTLVEDLWGDAPPPTAEKTLQSHVVRLRDALGRGEDGSPLVTASLGYCLEVPLESLDSWCFERDLDSGRRALGAQDPKAAIPLLDQALSWWRGDAYAEFPDPAFAVSERLRLTELRALAHESRTDAALELGAGGELVAELEGRVRDEPYRERSWEQLVLALYRAGRQADALAAYQRARARLLDDLGLEPQTIAARFGEARPRSGPVAAASLARTCDRALEGGRAAATAGATALAATAHALVAESTESHDLTLVSGVVPECPYRGLAAYDEEDAATFVGRERLTADLAGRLVDNDFVVIAGSSGAGKSSLLRQVLFLRCGAGRSPAARHGESRW